MCALTSWPTGPRPPYPEAPPLSTARPQDDGARSRTNGASVRLLRIIARLNIGGPSIQAITLTQRLEERGYASTLIRGLEGEREGNMSHLARDLGVDPVLVSALRRDPSWRDLTALLALVRLLRRHRPQVVHTHAAKAGTLGRVASVLAFPTRRSRPVLVHTFHGHSLSGYFSSRTTAVYRKIEQVLAARTDRLIAVSPEVRDDLVALGVAPLDRFTVIPLGFDLSPFTVAADTRSKMRTELRAELGIATDARVVTLIARLVPIKRVDRFLAAASMLADQDDVHFLIVGDGHLRDTLRASPDARRLGGRLTWAGFRTDMPRVCCASDLVVLTSDNEGTPVSLIEAAAAGLPTVSTLVGGASSVIVNGETGYLVDRDDGASLARAIRELLADEHKRSSMGIAARAHALRNFSLDRLVDDIDFLYRQLLTRRHTLPAIPA